MKLPVHLALLALAFLISVSGCKGHSSNTSAQLKKLDGDWIWQWSQGGIAGLTLTPETEGYTLTINFSEPGIYKKYKDGTLISKGSFTLLTDDETYSFDADFMIAYENEINVNQFVSFEGSDTLILYDECFDCFKHLYIKKK